MCPELGLVLAASGSRDGGGDSLALTWPPTFPDLNPLHYKIKALSGRGLLYAVESLVPIDLETID